MKSIRFHQQGGPEVLQLEESELPVSRADEVLLKVDLAGVNFIDVYHRRGQYPLPMPSGIGIEGIGTVESGERFFWLSALGSYAQYVALPQDSLTVLPPTSLSDEELLPLLCQGMTAHYLMDAAYPAKTGEVALVTAAAGGVGMLLIQLLKHQGVKVIALTSSPERSKIASEYGADVVGLYSQMGELVRANSDGGVNVVYDSIGKDYFDHCLDSLAPAGMYVLYGGASGPVPPFDLMRLNSRSLAIRRPTLSTYTADASSRERRLQALIALVESQSLRYPPAKIFSIGRSRQAHELIESRQYSGKIGIDPWKI